MLATAQYGKDKVRVFRVVRDPTSKVHDVVEYNVTVLVEGAIVTRCNPPRLPVLSWCIQSLSLCIILDL